MMFRFSRSTNASHSFLLSLEFEKKGYTFKITGSQQGQYNWKLELGRNGCKIPGVLLDRNHFKVDMKLSDGGYSLNGVRSELDEIGKTLRKAGKF